VQSFTIQLYIRRHDCRLGRQHIRPVQRPAGDDFVAISAGGLHCLALRADGSLAGWGSNSYRQSDVPQSKNFTMIAAGGYHSLAIRSDGTLAAWGWNKFQQCDVPFGKFIAIAAGSYHSLAIRSDGSLVAWGDNTYGSAMSLQAMILSTSRPTTTAAGLTKKTAQL